jgi:hypothetical protein
MGAADEYELLIYKKAAAKQQESRRRWTEKKLCRKGLSEEYIRNLLFRCLYTH